jgi:uroporphyrin-III C-methyltransferase
MGVARLSQIITVLLDPSNSQNRRDGVAFPPYTPIAIIERASMPDQRVITSTLKDIVKALDSNGEQRPPGTMVIGWSVLALSGEGDVTVLDDIELDEERVSRWLGGNDAVGWKVQEGLDKLWESSEWMDETRRENNEPRVVLQLSND